MKNYEDTTDVLMRRVRSRMDYQTKEEIAESFPGVPTHEVFHAYVAAKILNDHATKNN